MGYQGRVCGMFFSILALFVGSLFAYEYRFSDSNGMVMPIILLFVVVGLAWVLGKQFDKAKYFSERDTLTGVYNRRFIWRNFSKYAKKHKQLIIFVIDIDNFKIINDIYGHHVGDQTLKNITNILATVVRPKDIIARLGGDEFMILSYCKINESDKIIKDMNDIFNCGITFTDMKITVSIGAATYPNNGKGIDHLLRFADKNMYRNKDQTQLKYS